MLVLGDSDPRHTVEDGRHRGNRTVRDNRREAPIECLSVRR